MQKKKEDEEVKYAEAVDAWEASRIGIGEVSPFTAKKGAEKARLLNRFIGDVDVSEISPCDIEQALVVLRKRGGKRLNGLSSSTVRQAHLSGTQAIDWSIAHGACSINPFRLVPRPKSSSKRARFLSQEQANQLALFTEQNLEESMRAGRMSNAGFCACVLIALGTGLRRGEVFALDWDDINGNVVSISKSIKPDGSVGAPKTSASVRRITIGGSLAATLREFHEWQKTKLPRRGWDDPDPVLSASDGSRLSMNTFEHWWAKFRRQCGFDGLKFHELRHTHASMLIGAGVDVKTVQGRLGHSSADVTMNVYAHALPRNDEIAANKIDEMIFDNTGRTDGRDG